MQQDAYLERLGIRLCPEDLVVPVNWQQVEFSFYGVSQKFNLFTYINSWQTVCTRVTNVTSGSFKSRLAVASRHSTKSVHAGFTLKYWLSSQNYCFKFAYWQVK